MPETTSCIAPAFLPVEVTYPQKMETIMPAVSAALFDDVDSAVDAVNVAQKQWVSMTLEARKAVIENVRARARQHAKELAWAAWSETSMGRYEDKIAKNLLTANKTPGMEDLETFALTGDCGMTLFERAPYGVIGAVTPVTNPTSTIINNTISIIAAGNGVVYNPHPNGKLSTCRAIAIVNDAIVEAGGPASLIAGIREPTVDGAVQLMKHPKTAISLITGGPAVVKIALSTGKRAICAGPGNPPIVVDETADIDRAAKGIIAGASFDNNMICLDEKTLIVVDSVADKLTEALKANNAYILSAEELKKLESVIFVEECKDNGETMINKKMVGQDAPVILSQIGATCDPACRLLVAPVTREHTLVWSEQLMPVLPMVRVADVHEGIALAKESEHGFRHTACMYSSNIDNLTKMAKEMNVSIFVQNGPCLGGLGVNGEGFTSFSIAGTTGEGLTRPRTFTRERRIACINAMRMI